MSESVRLLKGIMKTSGWTQEQVAEKLGVSFQTMNAWVNGKSRPRKTMMGRIRALYLAQDITKDTDPTYITLVNVPRWMRIGDMVVLKKEPDNDYDEEAITATLMERDEAGVSETEDEFREDDMDGWRGCGEDVEEVEDFDDEGRKRGTEEDCLRTEGCIIPDNIYVANSINTVVRGTSSAGRIYDKFDRKARARILFILHKTAIARIVEWDYAEKGE